MEQIQLLQSFLMLQTTLNCLQRSNYLNKDSFSFAGVTEKSPQTKRTFGSDLFLQIISESIYLLIEHWDGSCKVENSEMQWVNQGNKQRPSLLSTAADYPACCYACSPCSFSLNFFFSSFLGILLTEETAVRPPWISGSWAGSCSRNTDGEGTHCCCIRWAGSVCQHWRPEETLSAQSQS